MCRKRQVMGHRVTGASRVGASLGLQPQRMAKMMNILDLSVHLPRMGLQSPHKPSHPVLGSVGPVRARTRWRQVVDADAALQDPVNRIFAPPVPPFLLEVFYTPVSIPLLAPSSAIRLACSPRGRRQDGSLRHHVQEPQGLPAHHRRLYGRFPLRL